MITLLTNKELEEKYPDWMYDNEDGVYDNLPSELFIVLEEYGRYKYTAIDNTTQDCHVETFDTLKCAFIYCLGYAEYKKFKGE